MSYGGGQRPGPPQGNHGPMPMTITTNSFEVAPLSNNNTAYFQYDALLANGPGGGKAVRRDRQVALMRHLVDVVRPDVFNPRLIYDSGKIAFSRGQLPSFSNQGAQFTIKLTSNTEVSTEERGSVTIILTSTNADPVRLSDLQDLIVNRSETTKSKIANTLLQIIIRQDAMSNHTNNGRAVFKPRGQFDLRNGLLLWPGVFLSARPTFSKMIVTVDTTMAAVYRPGGLVDTMMDLTGCRGDVAKLAFKSATDIRYKQLVKQLKGLLVTVSVGPGEGRARAKRIRDLQIRAGEYVFEKDGEECTVARHYHQAYNQRVRYPQIVGVVFSGKNAPFKVVVPAEFVNVEPGQLYKFKLDPTSTSSMIRQTTVHPGARLGNIVKAEELGGTFIRENNITINDNPMRIRATLLTVPQIGFNETLPLEKFPKGVWNILNKRFYKPCQLRFWAILNLAGHDLQDSAIMSQFQMLVTCCNLLGMNEYCLPLLTHGPLIDHVIDPAPAPCAFINGNPMDVEASFVKVLRQASDTLKKSDFPLDFIILVIVPDRAGPARNTVKFLGDCKFGILTQCMKADKVRTANNQYWNNIALKLNARLGGINSCIFPQEVTMQGLRQSPFMIMGADVSHAAPGSHKPSITSLVYSYDMNATQYAALTAIQTPRQEIIEDMYHFVKIALTNFFKEHKGNVPQRIIFYRDGVSEGEFETVAEREVEAVKNAIKDFKAEFKSDAPSTKLTFLVVGKRRAHSIPHEGNRVDNCPPGTLVDDGIVHPGRYPNFYLQSHAAIKGTSRSGHYTVLLDEAVNNPAILKNLTFHLCHVYAKATRSVSIPAPVYYADLVCARGAFHIDPNSELVIDDSVSVVSNRSSFNLEEWKSVFRPIHPRLVRSMYFI